MVDENPSPSFASTPLDPTLYGVPWAIARLCDAMLRNPNCRADHALLMADALDEILRGGLHRTYEAECKRLAADLREAAPHYANRPTIPPENEAS